METHRMGCRWSRERLGAEDDKGKRRCCSPCRPRGKLPDSLTLPSRGMTRLKPSTPKLNRTALSWPVKAPSSKAGARRALLGSLARPPDHRLLPCPPTTTTRNSPRKSARRATRQIAPAKQPSKLVRPHPLIDSWSVHRTDTSFDSPAVQVDTATRRCRHNCSSPQGHSRARSKCRDPEEEAQRRSQGKGTYPGR